MSYSAFLVEIMRLMDGDELSPSDLPLNTLQQVVSLAERRIYGDARTRYNQKSFSTALINGAVAAVEVTNNLAPIPDDFEAISAIHFGKKPLLPQSDEFLREFNLANSSGDCIYFAAVGAEFTFGPAVADGTLLEGSYYCRMPALDATTALTNQLFIQEHDLFMAAAMLEGCPIFKKYAEIPTWEMKYRTIVDRVNKRTENAAYTAGRMRVRPSAKVLR